MTTGRRSIRHPHFLLFGAALVVLAPAAAWTLGPGLGTLVGFDGAAIVFLISATSSMRGTDRAGIRVRARLYDARPVWLLVTMLAVLGIVLIAVAVETNGTGGTIETKVVPLTTLALAWLFSNMVFALHYAHMYYRDTDGEDAGGIRLPDDAPPTYLDFCYFSFVIGMTFQVSDIDITSRDIRAASLVHSLVAFFFNVGVIALSVNILASH